MKSKCCLIDRIDASTFATTGMNQTCILTKAWRKGGNFSVNLQRESMIPFFSKAKTARINDEVFYER
jgi:hypothetical protein